MRVGRLSLLVGLALMGASSAGAQTFTVDDPVLERMWEVGMENSRALELAQVLLDSIGPRLPGTPGMAAAEDWVVGQYESWGIDARTEEYGTWIGWERGTTHIDLVEPRVRTLEGTMLAWTPSGKKKAGVVILPDVADSAAFIAWLPQVKGKYGLLSMGEPACRPDGDWEGTTLTVRVGGKAHVHTMGSNTTITNLAY